MTDPPLAEGEVVLVAATVREPFADEVYVSIEVGTRGLRQSVWVSRDAIVRRKPRRSRIYARIYRIYKVLRSVLGLA
jgi:hypothetical protein